VHPLIEAFRSVAVFLDEDEAGRTTGPDLGALARWVVAWDAWYRRTTGIDAGRRRHLMYRREVGVATAIRLEQWEGLRAVAGVCQALGVGWGLTLDGRDASRDAEAARSMFAEGLIQAVALSYGPDEALPANTADLVAAAFDLNLRVTLVGSMRRFLESGVLSAPGVNGRHLTLEPTLPVTLRDVLDASEPCFRRFRVLVDPSGDLYPCAGLLGLRHLRLGNISESFEETVFGRGRGPLELNALATCGPAIGLGRDQPVTSTGLPLLCDLHRAQLEEAGGPA